MAQCGRSPGQFIDSAVTGFPISYSNAMLGVPMTSAALGDVR